MSRHSHLKKTVLRGVYEDNTGLPRSSQGRGRRSRLVAESPLPRHWLGFRGRLVVVALLGIGTLLGINFRLVTVDGNGPVAMQVVEPQMLPLPAVSLDLLNATLDGYRPGRNQPDPAEAPEFPVNAPVSSVHYDAMLAHLAMPMADLFDLEVQTIVIDPGHGGIDPGAMGHQGLKEKDVALDIARRLQHKLESSGKYRILLTREEDRKVFLKERVAFANDNSADLFISIHINSLPDGAGPLNYVETYYFGPHTDQRSLELAEQENRDSDYVMGDFRKVIARIGDTLKTQESRDLAGFIHQRLYNNLRRRNPGIMDAGAKTGPFVVLLGVDVPSVLVEVSCISNKAEETRLSRPQYRDDVADFLKAGIVDYLQQRSDRIRQEGGRIHNVAKQERQHAVYRD